MADILLTPEVLMSQSTELSSIQGEYESLFGQVTKSLNGINDSWSENLSRNFVGKITAAQKSFSSITNMLANGSNAAKAVATSFESGLSINAAIESEMGTIPFGSSGMEGATATTLDQVEEPNTYEKWKQVDEYYREKAHDYEAKASDALNKGDYGSAVQHFGNALKQEIKKGINTAVQPIAYVGSMLGWDNQDTYDS